MKRITIITIFASLLLILNGNNTNAQSITGYFNVCPNSPYSYFVEVFGGSGYKWTATGGTINGSSTSPSVSVTWSTAGGNKEIQFRYWKQGQGWTTLTQTIYSLAAGDISGNQTKCNGSNGSVSVNGAITNPSNWQKRTYNGSSWSAWMDVAGTSSTYSFSNIQQTTRFRAEYGNCGIYSNYTTVTVNPTSVGGSISGSITGCSSASATLTLSGHTGHVVKWQKSTNEGLSWTNISNTSTTLSVSGITQYTMYRAQVKSGVCSSKYSSTAYVNVSSTSIGGTISGAGSHCQSGSGTLTLSGKRGNVVKWQKKVGSGSWQNISNTSTTQSYSNVTTDTYYRAQVKNGVCSAVYSSAALVDIDDTSTSGTVTGNFSVCNSGNTTLTVSGHNGSVLRWQYSTNNGSSWTNLNTTSAQITVSPVSQNTLYTAYTANGSCSGVSSNSVEIPVYTPSYGGWITGGGTFCGSATGTIALQTLPAHPNPHVGDVQTWQMRINGGSWSNYPGSAGQTSIAYDIQSPGVYEFQAKVVNVDCLPDYSNIKSVIVSPETVAGLIYLTQEVSPGDGNQSNILVCKSTDVTATLSGHQGSVIRWESSIDGGATWVTISETTSERTFSAIKNTVLRAYVSNGSCPAYSEEATVNISAPTVAGTISGGGIFCDSATDELTITGETGTVVGWSYSENSGISWTPVLNSASPTLLIENVTIDRHYKARVDNDACPPADTDPVFVGIKSSVPGTLTVDGSNNTCGLATGLLKVEGANEDINEFQQSADQVTWYPYHGELIQPNAGNDSGHDEVDYHIYGLKSYFRAEVQLDNCPVVYTNVVEIHSSEPTEASTIQLSMGTEPVYIDQGSGSLEITGTTKGSILWEESSDGTNWSIIPNETDDTYDFSLTEKNFYRVRATNPYCPWDVSNELTIDILNRGILTAPATAAYGEEITLSFDGSDGYLREWEVSFDGGNTFDLLDPGHLSDDYDFVMLEDTRFRTVIDLGAHGLYYSDEVTVSVDEAATPQTNYDQVQRTAVLEPISDPMAIPAPGTEATLVSRAYMDGLGRPLQSIIKKASPLQHDMAQINAYDHLGRQTKKYVPYATDDPATNQLDMSDLLATQQTFYSQSGDQIANSSSPYAEVVYDESPLQRVMESAAPGDHWKLGSGHTVAYAYRTNTADEVRQWKADGTSPGFYPADELWVTEITDENGHKTQTFVNRSGQMVLQRRESGPGQWAGTTPIYDELGRIKYTISPEGLNALPTTGSTSLTASFIHDWVFEYAYDVFGRVVEKKVPGAAVQYFIYDRLDRVVLTQDGNLRAKDQWTYVKYDQRSRPIMTGLYTHSTAISRSAMQALIDAESDYHEDEAAGGHGYTNQAFPTTNAEVHTVSYYDDYDFDNDGTIDYSYMAEGYTGEAAPFGRTRGLTTGSKVRILDTDTWLMSAIFYDKYGRTIQAQGQNHFGGTDRATTQYDFAGRALKSWQRHHTATDTIVMVNRYAYDHAGRMLAQYQQVQDEPEIQLASYSYNDLGQLIDKKLHSADNGTSFMQSLDYAYNIRGWLTSLNSVALDDTETDARPDLFGMELLYGSSEATSAQYNGNIAAMRWNKLGDAGASMYDYSYDAMNRLTAADYKVKGANWSSGAIHQDEYNTTTTYDLNGNITALTRNSLDSILTPIDDLTYTYTGNQLMAVADAIDEEAGFYDGVSSAEEYVYDANGNMTKDLNKGMDSVYYNHMNKPYAVKLSETTPGASDSIRYYYAASGTKLAQEEYQDGVLTRRTDYQGGFIYQDSVLQYIQHSEGRIVPVPGPVPGSPSYEHQYHLTDHLGNVRMMLTTAERTTVTRATMESSQAETEAAIFFNYEEAVVIDAELFDHTDSPTDTTHNAILLYGGLGENIGLVRQLKVLPGDTIRMEVFAKYYEEQNPGDLSNLISTIGAQLATGGTYLGAENGALGNSVPWADLTRSGVDPGVPEGYLNYMVFDQQFNLISEKTGFQQVSSAAKETGSDTPHEALNHELVIEESGYVYIYLSNESESGVDVFFDDFEVEQVHGPIIQANNYYPFGLQTSASYQQDFITPNNRLFNAGSELNKLTKNYETFYRHYDPVLGRFNGVDIMASQMTAWSPYHFGFNNPILYNDPMGDLPLPREKYQMLSRETDGPGQVGGAGGSNPYGRVNIHAGSGNHWSDDFRDLNDPMYSSSAIERMYGSVTFYNEHCGCYVKAVDFLKFGDSNGYQRESLRRQAQAAIDGARANKGNKSINLFDFEIVLGGDGRMGDAVYYLKSRSGKKTILVDVDGVFGMERGFYKDFMNKVNNVTRNAENKEFWEDLFGDLIGSVSGLILEINPNLTPDLGPVSTEQHIIEDTIQIIKTDTSWYYPPKFNAQGYGQDAVVTYTFSNGADSTGTKQFIEH